MECSASAVWPSLTAHPQRCTSSVKDASSKGFIISPNAISSQGPNVQTQEPRLISYWNQHHIFFFFLETYGLIWQHTQLGNSISTRPGTTNGRPSCFTLQLCKQVLSRRKDYKTMGLAQCRQWGVWEARRRTPALPLILPLWGHEKTDRAPRHHSLCLPNRDSPVFSHLRRRVRSVRPNMERIWRQSLD